MATIADELAIKAVDIEQDKVLKPIAEGIESGLSKIPGEQEAVEEELKPLERALGGDAPLPTFDAPTPGTARVPAPGGGTIEVPITTSNVDPEGRIIGGDSDFINDLDAKLQELRKQKLVKTAPFNFQLDADGNLKLPKNPRAKASITLFKQISEDPQFTAEEREHLLGSFSPKTKELVQGQEVSELFPIEPVVPGEISPSVVSPAVRKAEIEDILTDTFGVQPKTLLGMEKAGINIPRIFATIDDIKASQGVDLPKAEIKNIFDFAVSESEKGVSMDVIEQRLKEIYTDLEKDASGQILTPQKIKQALRDFNPELAGARGVLTEPEIEQIKSLPKLKTMEPLPGSIFAEQPGDFVPAGEPLQLDIPEETVSPTEVVKNLPADVSSVPGAGELTEATSPFEDIPEESSSEQGFLAKAVDKIKSGSFTEGFAEIKNSSLYKGTLSALRSDFTKGLLAGAGLSAAGISAYEALLQEDEKGDLNLIPSDLKNLDKTLEKLNETFKLATEISKAKEGALQRFNQATLDPVRNRQRQNDLEKLEREDARIKGQLTEMKKKVETTMRLLKNKDAKNDKEIQREKAIKKTKEQADKRKVAQEVSALKRGVLQPRLQKDMAPKIKISINNSPKNRVDPVMNQTQM